MSENILEKIIKKKSEKIIELKKHITIKSLEEKIEKNKTFINFKNKITNNINNNKISIIAEIKKASPSAGIIIKDYNPVNIAQIFNDNKVFGIGPKMFREICQNEKYYTFTDLDGSINGCQTHPHNTYLQLLTETGILGTIPILFLLSLSCVLYFQR